MEEKAVLFGGAQTLAGVLAGPGTLGRPSELPAVILLDAGLIHRVGPNRVHVKLARDLAALGLCALRFDFAGIGDSDSRDDNVPFEASAVHETTQAMDYLESTYGIRRFILAGICSGANVALRTACHDSRVVGVAAVNGTFMDTIQCQYLKERLEDGVRRRYYRKHVFDVGRWRKLLTGRTNLRHAAGLVTSRMPGLLHRHRPAQRQLDLSVECRLALDHGVRLLLIYSEGSSAWDAFHLTLESGLRSWRTSDRLRVKTVEDTDHVFTLLWSQKLLVDLMHQWVCDSWIAAPAPDVPCGTVAVSLPSMEPNGRT
jgi:pimeloyl-ACP methyl ester carboxylesterase